MTGSQLYDYHTAFRDFSGTELDEYAQNLQTAVMLFGEQKVFDLLVQADHQNKKIELIEDTNNIGEPTGLRLV
ncbi:hypothetical protein D3C87_850960 [compost metagenome]